MEFAQVVISGRDLSPRTENILDVLRDVLQDLAQDLGMTYNSVDIKVSISAD